MRARARARACVCVCVCVCVSLCVFLSVDEKYQVVVLLICFHLFVVDCGGDLLLLFLFSFWYVFSCFVVLFDCSVPAFAFMWNLDASEYPLTFIYLQISFFL